MKKILLSLFVLVHLPGFVAAGEYNFTLINKTGFEIFDLFFSPASRGDWGDEVLTMDTLPNGEKMNIRISRKENAEMWDIQVKDEQEHSFKWPGVKLSEINEIILTIKAGEPMAFYE